MKITFSPPPEQITQAYLAEVLRKIESHLNDIPELERLYAEPARPRLGMLVIADGSEWDPGSGTGTYVYFGSWRRLDG